MNRNSRSKDGKHNSMTNVPTEVAPAVAWGALLRTATALIRTYERAMEEEVGVPLARYDVLIQLYEAPDQRLRMQALADAVILSRSGLTRLVDRIEGEGLLLREHSREDRRGTYAVLTEAGRQMVERARPYITAGSKSTSHST